MAISLLSLTNNSTVLEYEHPDNNDVGDRMSIRSTIIHCGRSFDEQNHHNRRQNDIAETAKLLADIFNAPLRFHLRRRRGLRRQLQNRGLLAFTQLSQQGSGPVGKFQRIMMARFLGLVDLSKDSCRVTDGLRLLP